MNELKQENFQSFAPKEQIQTFRDTLLPSIFLKTPIIFSFSFFSLISSFSEISPS